MRIIDTTPGNLMPVSDVHIETLPPINGYPVLDLSPTPWPRHERIMMELAGSKGDDVWKGTPEAPSRALWTQYASGGCVPVAAAEVDPGPPRTVRWISLTHATGSNKPDTLTQGATNWWHVYVVFVVYSGAHTGSGVDDMMNHIGQYLNVLPGYGYIPQRNIIAIYGPHTSLAISPTAQVGVLPGDKAPTPLVQQNGSSIKKCYISTATCLALGLPDDCDELMTLRWFRDNVLLKTANGARDVERYYREAPGIVAEIDQSHNSLEIYQGIYRKIIRPAVNAIKCRDYESAHALFKRVISQGHRV